jgi:hypothetical protein
VAAIAGLGFAHATVTGQSGNARRTVTENPHWHFFVLISSWINFGHGVPDNLWWAVVIHVSSMRLELCGGA